jgi:hypothetical protein
MQKLSNEIIADNPGEEMDIQPQEEFETPNRNHQKRTSPYLIVKMQDYRTKKEYQERIEGPEIHPHNYSHDSQQIESCQKHTLEKDSLSNTWC